MNNGSQDRGRYSQRCSCRYCQASLEGFEKDIREFQNQTGHEVPDFILGGILVNGVQDPALKDHLVMHSARLDNYAKLRAEVWEIARAKSMLVGDPMEVDALRKGKGKGKDNDKGKGKGKWQQGEKGKGKYKGKKEVECFYCGRLGHKKTDCRKRQVDLAKAKAEGRPHTAGAGRIHELAEDGQGQVVTQVAGLMAEDRVYLWVLGDDPWTRVKDVPLHGLVLLDSGAAVNACPKNFGSKFGFDAVEKQLNLTAANGQKVEHLGRRTVKARFGEQVYSVPFEVADVSGPIVSLARMEDAGWNLTCRGGARHLSRSSNGEDEVIPVVRRGGVFWMSLSQEAEVSDTTSLMLCDLGDEDQKADDDANADLEAVPGARGRTIRSKKIPTIPDDETRRAHNCVHMPPRPWCEHCVHGFSIEDPHRSRDRENATVPEIQVDYMFLGAREEKSEANPKVELTWLALFTQLTWTRRRTW